MRRALTVERLEAEIGLGRWLNGPADAPVAVAVSGGGDSLALLHVARAWADRAGRKLVALSVDHRLQEASADWSRFAADRAAALGAPCRIIAWTGEKPSAGLPAAARRARHALLAEAARAAGARVILMGHTADDLAEAEAMRAAGESGGSPRVWSPSPAWPEGRGLFVLRPLLGVRRAELRALLALLGERWIDDPANDDPRFSRARARHSLSQRAVTPPAPAEGASPPPELSLFSQGAGGELTAPLSAFAAVSGEEMRPLLAAAVLCASGTVRPPRSAPLERLGDRIAEGADFVATLAGARLEARRERLVVCRERGRSEFALAPLPVGESVFDGRSLIVCGESGLSIAPLRGLAAKLPSLQRRRLAEIEPAARPGLPAIVTAKGEVFSPVLDPDRDVLVRPLALERLLAALGALPDEASVRRVEWARCGAGSRRPSGRASGEFAGA